MANIDTGKELKMSAARSLRLRETSVQVDVLSDDLKQQLALLDDDEIAVLNSIKAKLNSGLSDAVKKGADTVGGFVW
ncbi:MAG: aroma-sacti cluster domain-containing protein [Methylobacter sp.]